jgi:catechol 2,3-dioxygenase-like lactoylglutathione lyase family enzyme
LYNGFGNVPRLNNRATVYERATPIEFSHVVFYTENLAAVEEWYIQGLGFRISDSYPGRGLFMRCSESGGHHDLFFLQLPHVKRGLNHLAFAVRDIHEVFGGGLHFSRRGWQTEIGPGRHPISSGYFWYFKCPAGGATEYAADEDFCTSDWLPREFQPVPENYAEWAAMGDVDMRTKKRNAAASVADPNDGGVRAS